jgi:probable rRNA maturation factor
MISLHFSDQIQTLDPARIGALLERAAQEALRSAAMEAADLSIVITDDAQLQELNRQYLGSDMPTDVLSFPAEETDPDSGEIYLGDILISLPRANEQASAGGHPVEDELQLLVVHGALHLLGHDHADEAEKAKMWQVQAEILKYLGCSIPGPASPTS